MLPSNDMGGDEWVLYGRTWKEFCADGLNRAGTLTVIREPGFDIATNVIIGDVSCLGGDCGVHTAVYDDEIVVYYCRPKAIDDLFKRSP